MTLSSQTRAKNSEAGIIKADYSLQKRIGIGPLDKARLERCREVADNMSVDFGPVAGASLEALAEAVSEARKGELETDAVKSMMTVPVMQLKANGAMFDYPLIGSLANIMLSFLESIEDLDEDAISIVSAHHKTLSAIVAKELKGDGGKYGVLMQDELRGACRRYFTKRKLQ